MGQKKPQRTSPLTVAQERELLAKINHVYSRAYLPRPKDPPAIAKARALVNNYESKLASKERHARTALGETCSRARLAVLFSPTVEKAFLEACGFTRFVRDLGFEIER